MDSQVSPSQSLFQVYYLGSLEVDRRCGSGVLPWIIEELKLKLETAQDMRLIWITLGPVSIAYVADSGKHIQQHLYEDIIRCTTGQDNVSFAYIIHSDKDNNKSFCHVFQSLDLEEASTIALLLTEHRVSMDNKNEPVTYPGERLATLIRQSKKSKFMTGKGLSSRRYSIDPSSDTLFPVTYCGSMPFKKQTLTAEMVDSFVKCLSVQNRPASADRYKKWHRKKRSNTFTSPKTNGIFRLQSSGSDDVDYPGQILDEEERDEDEGDEDIIVSKSLSDLDNIILSQATPTGPPLRTDSHPRSSSNASHGSMGDEIPQITVTEEEKHPNSGSGSGSLKQTDSHPQSNLKKKQWSFRGLRKGKSYSSMDKNSSGDDSPSGLKAYDSGSLGDSVGSLREIESDVETSLTPLLPNRSVTAPTPAARIPNGFESSGEHEEDDDEPAVGPQGSDRESDSYDMLPELEEVSHDPEFSLLSGDLTTKKIRQYMSSVMSATLAISGAKLAISTVRSEESKLTKEEEDRVREGEALVEYKSSTLLEVAVIQILCCSQGKNSPEYVAFVCRQKGTKQCNLYLLRGMSDRDATGMVKAFKYAFEYNMALSIPNYVCNTCPIKHLNIVCKELNKITVAEGLIRIKEIILSVISESEYSAIAKDYKKEPFENDHNQLVRWVALLRDFFHRQQSSHHHGAAEKTKTKFKSQSVGIKKGKKLLALGRLSGSHENLKSAKDLKDDGKKAGSPLHSFSSSQIHSTEYPTERVSSPLTAASVAILESQYNNDVTVTQAESREGSASTTPDIPRYKSILPSSASFPPADLKMGSLMSSEVTMEMSRPRTDSGSPESSTNGSGQNGRGHKRSMSWRQQIFESVTPRKDGELRQRQASIKMIVMETPSNHRVNQNLGLSKALSKEQSSSARARKRWKWAIAQQLLLVKLDRENRSVMREKSRHHKLNYEDPGSENSAISKVWSELIEQNTLSGEELFAAVKMGIPPKMREKAWQLLVSHYHFLHPGEVPMGNYPSSVDQLEYDHYAEEETEYEPVIVADIDRTFPTHPYFTSSEGQKALHSILHSYAVSDRECGYCQGLSFVAGILLIHSPDERAAFVLLNHLMFLYSFRDIYSLDMFVLQTKLYQFSRLLHDKHPTLHTHLEDHDVTPFLYAAPWFLTIFSSQFSIPFVARVFDLVLFEGLETIFKVSLSLLVHYQYDILQLDNMETITNFLKITIPLRVVNDSSEILHMASQLGDLSPKLKTFETEYLVMHELMSTFHMEKKVSLSDTEAVNELLRKQNKDLIEQVVMCRGAIMRLEATVEKMEMTLSEQQMRMDRLEKETTSRHAPQPPPLSNQSTQTSVDETGASPQIELQHFSSHSTGSLQELLQEGLKNTGSKNNGSNVLKSPSVNGVPLQDSERLNGGTLFTSKNEPLSETGGEYTEENGEDSL